MIVTFIFKCNLTTQLQLLILIQCGGSESPPGNRIAKQTLVTASCNAFTWPQNAIADHKPRNFSVFQSITTCFGMPSTDLYASRLTAQISSYVSWQPDPSAKFIDALYISWRQFKLLYAFPPSGLIANCLKNWT